MPLRSACPLLDVAGLTVQYPGLTGWRRRPAVEGLDLTVQAGEAVALIGGAGAGKSTVARALTGQLLPQRGRIRFAGRDLLGCSVWRARRRRSSMRLLVADCYAALPPHRRVGAILSDALDPLRRLDPGHLVEALELVGLTPVRHYRDRYPHQLSRAGRQRVVLARALIAEPRLMLADEPTGMLDERGRREWVDLLAELRTHYGIAMLYLTEDPELARRGCDRVLVLRGGKVVERGPVERVLTQPQHPYTAELVTAQPGW